jgi:hydroxyacylglutathione hydrolase
MIVHTLIAPYRIANNYLIEIEKGKFVGIDLGSINSKKITDIINANEGELVGYFLTHAHADHTVGIKEMWDLYQMPIFCSASAALDINNPRKNFSIYSEEIETFKYDLPFTIVADEEVVCLGLQSFQIISTPGHSPGCMVIVHENAIFTGDFAMADYKTPLTLPNSSREEYALSREKFSNYCADSEFILYPGHGRAFTNREESI